MQNFRGRSKGDRCLFNFNVDGREVTIDVPWNEAEDLIKQMHTVQKAAEEHAHANRIIGDSALLLRKGIPLGFSNHPKILRESAKEAAHNRDLRRYLPGGVKSKEQFGQPTIINHGDRNVLQA